MPHPTTGIPHRGPIALISLLLFSLLISSTSAHMALLEPPPINANNNPYKEDGKADYDYTAPISGANYPCRGHLKDLGTPRGRSVRTYAPGGTYPMSFTGGASHSGGSCQASLSYDRGTTFKVINSYIGGCPLSSVQFTIPRGAPTGEAIFAWTWFNNLGNREMYMNCAVVTIGNGARKRGLGSGNSTEPAEVDDVEYSKLRARALSGPNIFVANVGNGCSTAAGTDVVFPSPGDSVAWGNGGARADPVGTCDGRTFQGGGAYGASAGSAADSGAGGGVAGGSESGANGGGGKGGCAYWKTQGYVCSAGSRSIATAMGAMMWMTAFVLIWRLLA